MPTASDVIRQCAGGDCRRARRAGVGRVHESDGPPRDERYDLDTNLTALVDLSGCWMAARKRDAPARRWCSTSTAAWARPEGRRAPAARATTAIWPTEGSRRAVSAALRPESGHDGPGIARRPRPTSTTSDSKPGFPPVIWVMSG